MKFLFICTHNRCRSILAEAITNDLSRGRIQARSAGSQPAGEVHPLSVRYLEKHGFSTSGLTSNSWDEFQSWEPDVVITVCDSAASEPCPVWFGNSIEAHWGLEDPSRIQGNEAEIEEAFSETIENIKSRIERLLAEPFEDFPPEKLGAILNDLGKNNGPV